MNTIIQDLQKCSLTLYGREDGVWKLSEEEANNVRLVLRSSFIHEEGYLTTPDDSIEAVPSVVADDVWAWILDFIEGPCLAFWNVNQFGQFIRYSDAHQLRQLMKLAGIPSRFYVTNEAVDYLMMYDDGILYALGKAANWLTKSTHKIYELLDLDIPKPEYNLSETPSKLYLTESQFTDWGNDVTFKCFWGKLEQMPFHLICRSCSSIEWKPFNARRETISPIRHIYMPSKLRGRKKIIRLQTYEFSTYIRCDDIMVNKR